MTINSYMNMEREREREYLATSSFNNNTSILTTTKLNKLNKHEFNILAMNTVIVKFNKQL